jgi:hypothetical protein
MLSRFRRSIARCAREQDIDKAGRAQELTSTVCGNCSMRRSFPSSRPRRARLLDKYDPPLYAGIGEARKTPYNRNGTYRKVPEQLWELLDQYGHARQQAAGGKDGEIDAAILALDPIMTKAEALVGLDHRTHGSMEGSFDEAIGEVRQAMHPYEYRFGRRVLAPINGRFNRANEEHRVIVRLRERGKKVVAVAG